MTTWFAGAIWRCSPTFGRVWFFARNKELFLASSLNKEEGVWFYRKENISSIAKRINIYFVA